MKSTIAPSSFFFSFFFFSSLFSLLFLVSPANGLMPIPLSLTRLKYSGPPGVYIPVNLTSQGYEEIKHILPANTSFAVCPQGKSTCVRFKNATELEESGYGNPKRTRQSHIPGPYHWSIAWLLAFIWIGIGVAIKGGVCKC
ncbi:hypothetical protein PT974_11354 [Cladobotryum mycophilum]|uniref:Uncharacterized protein n=1 Tax=Cladobotryum mycophilum TaxID=491253 RepID=A0ABR0S5Z5_9HYPO